MDLVLGLAIFIGGFLAGCIVTEVMSRKGFGWQNPFIFLR